MSLARNVWPTRRRPPARSALLSIAVTHACLFGGVFLVGFLAEGTAAPRGLHRAVGRAEANPLGRTVVPDPSPGPLEAEFAADGIRVLAFRPDDPVLGPLDPTSSRPAADVEPSPHPTGKNTGTSSTSSTSTKTVSGVPARR